MQQDDFGKKFENFLHAFGAARLLLKRAHDSGFLIEGIILYASIIDGLLRNALILKSQLGSKGSVIDEALISQEGRSRYTEKMIYSLALNKRIIDQELHSELMHLYGMRNGIVHRFFLTGIEYAHLPEVLIRYEHLYNILFRIVYALEAEQVKRGVGMTVSKNITIEDKEMIHKKVMSKIDSSKPTISDL
ncbi:MAG: hypothetical protein HYW90_02590 [Candidatus Sungbacteria bacterium]|nr:hypothetical protein [Candidatus Sungbacteria bacterium]